MVYFTTSSSIWVRYFPWGIAAFLGLIFGLIFLGPNLLDPQNIAWLAGGLDPTQHYLGWVFYRHSPWAWPAGASPEYGIEIASSIVFTDSIPFLALVFKAFHPFLPETFQYLGLWTISCFVLQALIAYALSGLIYPDKFIRILITLFFITSPAMLIRMGFQTALASHFLILAALYLNLRKPLKRQSMLWSGLIFFTTLIHFYLLIMVLILWITDSVRRIREGELTLAQFGLQSVLTTICLIFLFWQAGYFMLMGVVASDNQYGIGRLNLLSIFNADGWSYILPNLPLADRVYEGFIYLGLGVIICFLAALYGMRTHTIHWRTLIRRYKYLLVSSIAMTLFAISNQIGIGPWSLVIPLPDSLLAVAGILRASGRLFWPVYYLFMIGIFYVLLQAYSKKVVTLIIVSALFIQVIDTSSGWMPVRQKYMQAKVAQWQTPLENIFWQEAGKAYNTLVLVPAGNNQPQWSLWANYAAHHLMSTNSVFLARYNQTKLNAANAALNKRLSMGEYDPKTLYILEIDKLIPALLHLDPKKDLLARIDGFYVLAPNWQLCSTCSKVSPEHIVHISTFMPQIGEVIAFGRNQSTKYLLNISQGWAHPESWGIWSDGGQAQLILGIPQQGAKSLTLTIRTLVTPTHPTQEIGITVNDEQRPTITLTKDSDNQIIIPITKENEQAGYLNIKFQFKSPASPKDLGIGDDSRLLSIGLERAIFK